MNQQQIEELERDPERAWRETGSKLRQTSLRRRSPATAVTKSGIITSDRTLPFRVSEVMDRNGCGTLHD